MAKQAAGQLEKQPSPVQQQFQLPEKTRNRISALYAEIHSTINTAAEIIGVPDGWQYNPISGVFTPPLPSGTPTQQLELAE